jgi:hypothetical protein
MERFLPVLRFICTFKRPVSSNVARGRGHAAVKDEPAPNTKRISGAVKKRKQQICR